MVYKFIASALTWVGWASPMLSDPGKYFEKVTSKEYQGWGGEVGNTKDLSDKHPSHRRGNQKSP